MAQYIGGLRVKIQEIVNLFDPILVSATHQKGITDRKVIRAKVWWCIVN